MFTFVTSNRGKAIIARRYLEPFNIFFQRQRLDLIEIQSDSVVDIAVAKAKQAFTIIQQPLLVTDDGWFIKALNGFPGPYMKYMNVWLTADDFLKLMHGQRDREVTKREVVCYIDENQLRHFVHDIKGFVLEEKKGNGLPAMQVVTLSPTHKSVAECDAEGIDLPDSHRVWEAFAKWYKEERILEKQ